MAYDGKSESILLKKWCFYNNKNGILTHSIVKVGSLCLGFLIWEGTMYFKCICVCVWKLQSMLLMETEKIKNKDKHAVNVLQLQ